jgi:hypothetical protein
MWEKAHLKQGFRSKSLKSIPLISTLKIPCMIFCLSLPLAVGSNYINCYDIIFFPSLSIKSLNCLRFGPNAFGDGNT